MSRLSHAGSAELELVLMLVTFIAVVAALVIVLSAWLAADVDLFKRVAPAARAAAVASRAWTEVDAPDGTILPGGGGATRSALCEVDLRGKVAGGPQMDAAGMFVRTKGTPMDAAACGFFMKLPLPIVPRETGGKTEVTSNQGA